MCPGIHSRARRARTGIVESLTAFFQERAWSEVTVTFHIRLVSPPGLSEQLVDVLLADSGVSNLVVHTGSARRPEGDAVQFDVLARSANSVLRQLEAIADDRRGPVTVETVDASIGGEAIAPPRHRLVQRDVVPVWDVVEARIRSDAVYAPVSTSCWP
jgi:hypothetical protein